MADSCPPCKKGAPAYMMTFGDMMSLLLCFFVLLLSMSQFVRVKFEKAAGSLKDAFGIQRIQQMNAWPSGSVMVAIEFQQEIVLVKLKEKLEISMANLIDNGEAELVETEQGFLIRFDNDALFEPGTLTLRDDIKPQFQQLANLLSTMPNLVRVVGHTDDQPPPADGLFKNNWARSAAYAAAIVQFFSTEGGVEPQRLEVRGMGQQLPRVSNETEEGRVKNRRIEVLVSRETLPVVVPQEGGAGPPPSVLPDGGGGKS
ncbi:MAG: OmpA family protein [Magnetococcales bacterium]|nr:OmpA family protein [Magnetococcales bacterium]